MTSPVYEQLNSVETLRGRPLRVRGWPLNVYAPRLAAGAATLTSPLSPHRPSGARNDRNVFPVGSPTG